MIASRRGLTVAVVQVADKQAWAAEVTKLREELQSMKADAQGSAARRREAGGNATETGDSGDYDADDSVSSSVRSLQRQLAQSIAQLETTRQQLTEEQRSRQDRDEHIRRLSADLQTREAEVLAIRRETEAALKGRLETDVAKAREETEVRMRHEHLTSKHQSAEEAVSKLEHDLADARADQKAKESELQSLRGELMRIRSALADEEPQHGSILAIAAGGGEAALVKSVRGQARRLAEEAKTLQEELAQERVKRSAEEAARRRADEEAGAHALALAAETERRKALEEKVAGEREAKVLVMLEAG
jgi:hypothetical protein